ncbi:MAG TPA: hypothetical protein VFV05_10840 [Methylomirabilota bacterium]|nr:hypothetical protein [Methylomirabilota bacterium]
MLDIVGAITLTVVAATAVGTLILTSPVERATRWRLALGAGSWYAVVTGLAAAGVFSTAGAGTPALGVAVVAPVVIVAVGAVRTPALRRLALGIPLAVLVVLNAGRLLGVFFLLLHADGRLPRTFALAAGSGDIAVGALALPLAWLVHRRGAGSRALALAWSSAGFLDLVAAVTLGVGSAPGSPLRFLFEEPGSGLMGTLPWLLIPGFLVPIYLLTHLAVFAQLATAAATRRTSSLPAWETHSARR